MVTVFCCNCGVEFGMTEYVDGRRKTDGATFYCPNGHGNVYGETPAQKLQKQLDEASRTIARKNAEVATARKQLDAAERKLARTQKSLTRIEKRIAKGICPCCDRRFENLAQHIGEHHPEFTAENPQLMRGIRGLLPEHGTVPRGD